MAPKKSRKVVQKTMVEEPTQDPDVPPQAMSGEKQKDSEGEQDHDSHEDHESEEEQPNAVLFTPEQLEVLLKMNRPHYNEFVTAFKGGSSKSVRFKPARPGNFQGARDLKVVDAWLAEMEDYLHAAKVGRHLAMELAQSYLKGYASTWWRTVRQEEGKTHGYTWEFFKEHIEWEFIPKNSDYISRCKLRDLVNASNDNLRQYVRAYSELMLEIRHMHELERVCHFVMGLPTWAKRKLEENSPASLTEGIMKVEGFSDVGRGEKSGFKRDSKFPHMKARHEGEWNRGQDTSKGKKPKQFQGSGFKPKGDFVKKGAPFKGSQPKGNASEKPRGACFNCNEVRHYSKDCPKLKLGNGVSKVIALTSNLGQGECNRLIFLKGKLSKREVLCLLDTRASHNFITQESAKRMVLPLEELKAPIEVHFVDGIPHPTKFQAKEVPF
jgi:hypothetical protein